MRALFSLHVTDQAETFAGALVSRGWEIVATEETCRVLRAHGVPVTPLDEFTGHRGDYPFPATLHPAVNWLVVSRRSHYNARLAVTAKSALSP